MKEDDSRDSLELIFVEFADIKANKQKTPRNNEIDSGLINLNI